MQSTNLVLIRRNNKEIIFYLDDTYPAHKLDLSPVIDVKIYDIPEEGLSNKQCEIE
jgi:hypothetical protein